MQNWCFRLKQQFNHSYISDLYFDRRDFVSKHYVKQAIKQNIHDG